jgi:hypothetical protein
MLHVDVTLEDCRLIVTVDKDGFWVGVAVDNLTGKELPVKYTNVQVGAILALGCGGEDFGQNLSADLYKIAEPCYKDVDPKFRMIP